MNEGEFSGSLQKIRRVAALATLASLLTGGCADVPPQPRQVIEFERHRALGQEKYASGQLPAARAAFQRALAHAEMDDDSRLIVAALLNLGASELALEESDAAARSFARAHREASRESDVGRQRAALNGLAEATRRLGQPAKAVELLASRPAAAPDTLADGLAVLTRVRARIDQRLFDAAREELDALVQSSDPANAELFAHLHHVRAVLALAEGAPVAAYRAAEQALTLDRQRHHPPAVAADHLLLGDAAWAAQRLDDARAHYERARNIFANTGQHRMKATVDEKIMAVSGK
jgi:tetratricopeptide (TPR) repeat protein